MGPSSSPSGFLLRWLFHVYSSPALRPSHATEAGKLHTLITPTRCGPAASTPGPESLRWLPRQPRPREAPGEAETGPPRMTASGLLSAAHQRDTFNQDMQGLGGPPLAPAVAGEHLLVPGTQQRRASQPQVRSGAEWGPEVSWRWRGRTRGPVRWPRVMTGFMPACRPAERRSPPRSTSALLTSPVLLCRAKRGTVSVRASPAASSPGMALRPPPAPDPAAPHPCRPAPEAWDRLEV